MRDLGVDRISYDAKFPVFMLANYLDGLM